MLRVLLFAATLLAAPSAMAQVAATGPVIMQLEADVCRAALTGDVIERDALRPVSFMKPRTCRVGLGATVGPLAVPFTIGGLGPLRPSGILLDTDVHAVFVADDEASPAIQLDIKTVTAAPLDDAELLIFAETTMLRSAEFADVAVTSAETVTWDGASAASVSASATDSEGSPVRVSYWVRSSPEGRFLTALARTPNDGTLDSVIETISLKR